MKRSHSDTVNIASACSTDATRLSSKLFAKVKGCNFCWIMRMIITNSVQRQTVESIPQCKPIAQHPTRNENKESDCIYLASGGNIKHAFAHL